MATKSWIIQESYIGNNCSIVLTVLCVVFLATTRAQANQSVYFDGDVVLGGLFPIHSKGGTQNVCGDLREEGVQRMEAMLYAVDLINDELKLLSNITIGVDIRDTCSEDNYALEQSLSFVASKFTQINPDAWSEECLYSKKPVAGVVGAAASEVSIIIANFLGIFKVPEISYASTSSALSDKSKYQYFSRVVPSDKFQTNAIIDIVEKFEWKYVSTVFSSGNYGEGGTEEFANLARDRGICIATSEKIYSTSETLEQDLDIIVNRLSEKPDARGVIAFVDEDDMDDLLRAVARNNKTGCFTFIGSDSWGTKISPVEGNNKLVAEGSITILPSRIPLAGFDEHFKSKNATSNDRNIWWNEFWENHFDCYFDESLAIKHGKEVCNEGDVISEETGYKQEGYVQFVVDSVLAFAYALNDMLEENCQDKSYICSNMHNNIFNGEKFLSYIRNVRFNGSAKNEVYFDENGDAPGRYDIYQYQKNNDSYDYVHVGKWDPTNLLIFDIEKTKWENWNNIPASFCSLPCNFGETKKVQTGDICCWVCVECNATSYVVGDNCEACKPGTGPNATKTGCELLDLEYIHWNSPWSYAPSIFASIGLACVFLVLFVFVKHNSTPIIKASGRELMYILLSGISFCYAMTFLLLAKPSKTICYLQRINLGLCLTICYSAILTKTVRISRIFNSKKKTYRMRYTSPFSQFIICFSLIFVQLIIVTVWVMLVPPKADEEYPEGRRVLVCDTNESELLGILLYSFVLIMMCTVYAFKTRKIPENFNEAKFIGFTSYTTCIVWIAFIAIYFGVAEIDSGYMIQTAALCITLSTSASTALACLFVPKVYIVLVQPTKNVRRPTISGSRRSVSNNESVYRSQNESFSSDVGHRTQDSSLSTTRETFHDLTSASNS